MQAAHSMPDIPQPTGLPGVDTRTDRRRQGGGDGRSPAARRAAETYQEADRARPFDDSVTIIGIPIEQITNSTRAALAGLVAENATLRAQVRRLETRLPAGAAPAMLDREPFLASFTELTGTPAGPGLAWSLFLIHVETYEDIRRSSGVLAANTVLADVGQRLRDVHLTWPVEGPAATTVPMACLGAIGGLTLVALASTPLDAELPVLCHQIRDQLSATGYDVAGLSMALAMKVAGATISRAESPLLAIARVDHLTRGPQAVG